ncbi:hypothetical protein FAI41_05905 [Acetobacteraceae bacterium]|nr:hypothetical protein FAI41_05905 [Acetobacteraceae bacterium]
MNLKENFTHVWKNNLWESSESRSGPGSERGSRIVQEALKLFDQIIPQFNICSINDIPCGDFNWFEIVLEKYPQIKYHGFDIVAEAIQAHNENFSQYRFTEFNAVLTLHHKQISFSAKKCSAI